MTRLLPRPQKRKQVIQKAGCRQLVHIFFLGLWNTPRVALEPPVEGQMDSRPRPKKIFIAPEEAMSPPSYSCGSWRVGCSVVANVVSKAGRVGTLEKELCDLAHITFSFWTFSVNKEPDLISTVPSSSTFWGSGLLSSVMRPKSHHQGGILWSLRMSMNLY